MLKPVDIVAKAIINSPLNIEPDDLLWQIQGELKNWLDRVRSRQATGRAMFWGKNIDAKEMPALRAFVEYFYYEVYVDYCQEERGILRSRLNRFKDGCEAYYVSWRAKQRIQETPEQDAEEATELVEM
jgi:CRISPR type I-D-associated protein Csc3/Cas10d